MKRPSPALIVALLALFVALGGPAQAKRLIKGSSIKKGTVTSKQIKNKTVAARDVSPALITQLTAIADGSITGAKLADGTVTSADLASDAVTGAKLADNAVTAAKLADGSVRTPMLVDGAVTEAKLANGAVTGKAVRDGSLDAQDIGGFAGKATVTLAAEGACTAGTSPPLTPLVAGQDLQNDAIVVTPPNTFPGATTVTARPAGPDTIRVTACGAAPPSGDVTFRYVTIDVGA